MNTGSHERNPELVWAKLCEEATHVIAQEPILASYVYNCILNHRSLASALSVILANKLADEVMSAVSLRELFKEAFEAAPTLIVAASADIRAVYERDAATSTYLPVVLYLKGFQSIQVHRLANYLWTHSRKALASFIQSRNSEVFAVDIHPGCTLGMGIMFDHATGIVIGETCIIDDDVSILQHVTLGGTGNEQGDRHPKVRSGVLISAGAKVLGNIEIGCGSKIGAGSVVLSDVRPHTTVVGVPAREIGKCEADSPAQTMDQSLDSH